MRRPPPGCAVAEPELLVPGWPAPAGVRAAFTLRGGGVSGGPFASFNLAGHVGDDAGAVAANRARLCSALHLPAEPLWLNQVHGCAVARFDGTLRPAADASVTARAAEICAVLVADCLPVLFTDRAGSCVAAAHAGWRGLADGVLERTIEALPAEPGTLLAWLGPAIGPAAFEVGDEVRDRFIAAQPGAAEAFQAQAPGRWLADLWRLARRRLASAGVTDVYGGQGCTHSEPQRFYSYRRDGVTGRHAALIWLE